MKKFRVYLKDREHPAIVEGAKMETDNGGLVIKNDKGLDVARFRTVELQGWCEITEKDA